MSIQFDRRRLLEDLDTGGFKEKITNYLMQYGKANKDAADMLAKAVIDKVITVDKAIEICKATTGLGEMSGTAAAGAYLPSLHATKKQQMGPELKEDAPRLAHGKADISTYTNDGFTKAKRGKGTVKGIEIKDLWEDDYTETDMDAADVDDSSKLNEGRGYSQFKKEAATRTKTQQMHEAAKMINKRLEEINRLLEYASQMKNELSEGETQFEYSHNTKNLFEKINTRVVETYTKLKKLK